MKLSISVPAAMAAEVRQLAQRSDRSVSWWINKAWQVARSQLSDPAEEEKRTKQALRKLHALRGSLKADFPATSSSILAKQAFAKRK